MYWEKVAYFSDKHHYVSLLYNLLVSLMGLLLVPAGYFNAKLRLFTSGRRGVIPFLKEHLDAQKPRIWVHAASLGEYEQGLPVIRALKVAYPDYQILVTFFSPSGYEVKKGTKEADLVTYLPLDTRSNCRGFLNAVNPDIAIFIKYEVWPNYLRELERRKIPAVLISAIFKASQIYFRPFGGFMRKALRKFEHYFVQDEKSGRLLESIGIQNYTISGDTRFDRVVEILEQQEGLPEIASFVQKHLCLVAGSTWPEDEKFLVPYINQTTKPLKIILVPHDIKKEHIQNLIQRISKPVTTYSELVETGNSDYEVLVVDTVGLLTRIYRFAQIAYVGGGFATGLHNTLEPAVYGIPVIIGPQFEGFREAEELVAQKGIFSIKHAQEFNSKCDSLLENEAFRKDTGNVNANYIRGNLGAKQKILDHLHKLLSNKEK